MNSSALTVRQQSTQLKRQQIIDAAAECFIEKGFYQTSMRDIAKLASVSLGNLYNHFDSKQSLIFEIASLEAEELSELESLLLEQGNTLKVIEKFANRFMVYSAEPANIALGVEISAAATRDQAIARAFAANRARISKRITSSLRLGRERGDIDPNIDDTEGAEFIIDLIESCAYRSVLSGVRVKRETKQSLSYLLRKYLSP